jgi:hypothetical protein
MNALYYARRIFKTRRSYIFGRFHTVRWMYACWMRQQDRFRGRSLPPLKGLPASEIICMEPSAAVDALHKTALAQCIMLPPDMVNEIVQFAHHTKYKLADKDIPPFRYADVQNAQLSDGTFVPLARCVDPTQCPAICKVRDDPVIQAIVANYLGYLPPIQDVSLYWSFAGGELNFERRRFLQTIEYHYDVHDYNFCYVHIYLTDTDVKSGAHVLVPGSHKSKPFRWLIGSARQSDEAIENYYGKEKILCLEGPAGTGFIEDTSCFHKALVPVSADRLLLQIRYH